MKAISSLGQKNIFEVLKKSLEDTNDRTNKDQATIRKLRDSASQSIQVYITSTLKIHIEYRVKYLIKVINIAFDRVFLRKSILLG